MEPIRVLYLDHVVHLSGAEQSLFDLVVGLAGGPVEPIVVLPEDGPLATQLRAAGVLVRKVKMSKRLLETSRTTLRTRPFVALLRLVSFIAVSFRLRHIIKEMHPQVIHTNTLKAHLMAIIPAKLSRTPLVWHVRDILPKGWLRWAFTQCARFPDRIVVPSRAVAQSMGRNKTVYRKLRLIPNGIRVDTFDDRDEGAGLRAEIGAGAKDTVIGIVGRLAPWKGQDVFVHAAAMVADRHPKARFAIIGTPMFGDDDFQHELASLVYQYDLDGRVMFAGWRGAQEAMAAVDIVVHASIEPEPFGRTIIEAMAAGRPVVAAAGGAIGEILPPNAGFIVPPGRPEILADALENLLSDRRMRTQMGEAGKAAAHRFFDVRRTISAVGTLYGEIARESAKNVARKSRRRGLLAMLPWRKAKQQPQRRPSGRIQPGTFPGRTHSGRQGSMQGGLPRGMPPRRPAAATSARRPPVLRPQAPDSIPAGRPQRRSPIRQEVTRPVRRTMRIDIDEETGGQLGDEIRQPSPRPRSRPAATSGRRSVPAMPEQARRPVEPPSRRVHRPAEYEGGHVIRRPAVLDSASFDDTIDTAIDDGPIRPVRRPVPPSFDQSDGMSASGHPAEPKTREAATDAGKADDTDADKADGGAQAEEDRKKRERRLFRLMSGAVTRRHSRPQANAPVSTGSTAPVLDPVPEPEPAPRPVVVAPVPVVPVPVVPVPVAPEPALVPSSVVTLVPFVVTPKPVYELLKRIIDVVVASIVLLVGSPLWLATALAIKLDSRGPVMFQGTVWGKDCKPFRYYKFRSMKIDGADDGHRKFIEHYVRTGSGVAHGDKTIFKYVGDPRITRIGRMIRKLSIDEIPQLINVLKGDMTLVGPRPPLEYEYELYDDWAKQRLVVRPGMTGLQQTYARHSAAFTEKVEMDLAYIRDRSMRLDLTIMLKTIPAAFKGE